MKLISFFIVLFICFFTTVAKSGVYKWVDSNGKVHYTDKPQPQKKKVMKLKLRSDISPEEADRARARLDALQNQQQHNETVRKLKRQEAQRNAEMRKLNDATAKNFNDCLSAKHNLKALNRKTNNAQKNGKFLSRKERAAEKKKAQMVHDKNC